MSATSTEYGQIPSSKQLRDRMAQKQQRYDNLMAECEVVGTLRTAVLVRFSLFYSKRGKSINNQGKLCLE